MNGRNAISWEDKFKLDVWYVDNWSSWLDVKILGMTVMRVLKREGDQPGGEGDDGGVFRVSRKGAKHFIKKTDRRFHGLNISNKDAK